MITTRIIGLLVVLSIALVTTMMASQTTQRQLAGADPQHCQPSECYNLGYSHGLADSNANAGIGCEGIPPPGL
jgi:hypothetical protein